MTEQNLRVVFLDRETISPKTIIPEFNFKHTLELFGKTNPDEVQERIANADIVITNKVAIHADQIRPAKNLKLIALAATGYDNVDTNICSELGISVCNIRDYANTTVPEHVFALIFALRRSLVPYANSVAKGRWQESNQFCYFDYPVKDLKGSTLGIIGKGTLGQATAEIGKSLGLNVLFAGRKNQKTPKEGYSTFTEVLQRSDIISLHCPLVEETNNLLSFEEFSLMKNQPLIINTARGGLIDNNALAKALEIKQISGAGIDVTVPEPPAADSILMQLLKYPNYILTPHIGWASQEAIQILTNQLVANINAFVSGKPKNLVN